MGFRKVEPLPGQESVWDYPRPPAIEPDERSVRVEYGGAVVAETDAAVRVLETSHPPGFYLPRRDVAMDYLVPSSTATICEFKGRAVYFDLVVGEHVSRDAAWSYPDPTPGFEAIRDALAFYPGRVDAAFVGGERVKPQEGDFYGGWITSEIVGPFKGGRGTWGW